MTYLTDKSANIRKTANLRRKLFPDLKSATNFASNKPKLFLRVSSPLIVSLFGLLNVFLQHIV